VHGLELEGFEDQEVDAPAESIRFLRMSSGHGSSLEVEKSIGRGPLEVKRTRSDVRVTWSYSAGASGKGCGEDGRGSDGRPAEIRLGVEGIRFP
jgi:hypothetical protein